MPLAPPWLIVWHEVHFLKVASPLAASAAASRFGSGTSFTPPSPEATPSMA